MDNIEQLIKQAKAVMTCPECGRHYRDNEISFKGFMDHTYVLQASCSNEHPTVYTTWITSYAPPANQRPVTPIETDHVLELHQALQHFDGNFRALWSKER